ncbi:MAG: dihydroorotate dehydrogenase [Epulopiscium sp.]|nr:dihydroorotate dehydrogenase [Candidatus Epulonipiscium sp.]
MNKENLDLKVNIGGVVLKNPVTVASGTFGSGREFAEFIDLNRLGAVTVKGVSSIPWKGNPAPRIAETYGGMLNSVGLQNPGVEELIKNDIPFLRQYDTKIIVNIAGKTIEEYCDVAEKLSHADIDLIELNISCPNVKEGGVAFGIDARMAKEVTREVKRHSKHPVIVKLSPNVTDITQIAKAVAEGGADGLSLINTLLGMAIDIHRRKPILANVVGGFSGPAIKPVALRMVYQVAKAVSLPIIGMGGITTGEDAIEFILAGATAVAVGTANFRNPRATMDVLDGIKEYMLNNGIKSLDEIRGIV